MPTPQQVCCVIGACCQSAVKRSESLAAQLQTEAGLSPDAAKDAAEWMISQYGIVPKAVAAAIVNGYQPHFAELHKGTPGA